MAIMKRVLQPQSHHKKVLKELKALFKKERCLIPMLCQECDFEGKILLGCELLRSYIQQKTKREARRHAGFEYPDFVICGLFERGNRLLYGAFSEIGFERDAMFVGEYQWRLNAERRRGVIG